MRYISLVIPTFWNEDTIHVLYDEIQSIANQYNERYTFEFVFVEDGSSDSTVSLLKNVRKNDTRVKIIVLSRNFGQVQALTAGLDVAKGDAVVLFSADLQEPLERIHDMISAWEQGNEIIIGYRIAREDNLIDKLLSNVFYRMIRTSIKNMPINGYDFALIDRIAVNQLITMKSHFRFLQGDILYLGFNVKLIPCARKKRYVGYSTRSLNTRIDYFLTGLLTTQIWPIRLTYIFLLTIFTCLLLLLLWKYTSYWLIIVFMYLFILFMILFMGLIIEYLWRLSKEVSNHPRFIIKEQITD